MTKELMVFFKRKILNGDFVTKLTLTFPSNMKGEDTWSYLISPAGHNNNPWPVMVGEEFQDYQKLLASQKLMAADQARLTSEFHSHLKLMMPLAGYGFDFDKNLLDVKSKITTPKPWDLISTQLAIVNVLHEEMLTTMA